MKTEEKSLKRNVLESVVCAILIVVICISIVFCTKPIAYAKDAEPPCVSHYGTVYIYSGGQCVDSMKNIKEITFGPRAIIVRLEDGTCTAVSPHSTWVVKKVVNKQ